MPLIADNGVREVYINLKAKVKDKKLKSLFRIMTTVNDVDDEIFPTLSKKKTEVNDMYIGGIENMAGLDLIMYKDGLKAGRAVKIMNKTLKKQISIALIAALLISNAGITSFADSVDKIPTTNRNVGGGFYYEENTSKVDSTTSDTDGTYLNYEDEAEEDKINNNDINHDAKINSKTEEHNENNNSNKNLTNGATNINQNNINEENNDNKKSTNEVANLNNNLTTDENNTD